MNDAKPTTTPAETKAAPKLEARPKPVVFVDYLGLPTAEGARQRGDRIATLVVGTDDDDATLPRIEIRPGLNVIEASAWRVHCPAQQPKVDKSKAPIGALVVDGHIVELEDLPTSEIDLLELAARTHSEDALEALIDHEQCRKGGTKKNSRARGAVMQALLTRAETVKRRAESPQTPGPRLRRNTAA